MNKKIQISKDNLVELYITKNLSPSEIVPQPGVYKIQDMDYIFIKLLQTKIYIKERYGKDVDDEGNSDQNDPTHNEDLVTHNYVYYKNIRRRFYEERIFKTKYEYRSISS